MKKLICPHDGAEMRFFANEEMQLGKTSWIFGDLPNLFSGALNVHIYICPACRKLEFFASAEEVEEDLPQKTCPVCGTVHDFDWPRCPNCKHDYYKK